jgi:CHAT domain-containing protein
MLLGGIARELHEEWRTKRLAIVAAGAIEYLPFAALPAPERDHAGAGAQTLDDQRASRTPLAADHEIVSIPSASVLAVLRREAADRAPAGRPLAVIADPVFDGTDPRVTRRPARPTAVDDDTSSRAIEVMDSLYARGGLSRLPFSREEADAISTLAGGAGVLKAVDFKASRTAVLGGALSGYRIVHLATHGVIDSETCGSMPIWLC